MSSIHNDLHSWAGKARAHGNDTIVITVDLADKAADIIVEQANRIAELEYLVNTAARADISNATA